MRVWVLLGRKAAIGYVKHVFFIYVDIWNDLSNLDVVLLNLLPWVTMHHHYSQLPKREQIRKKNTNCINWASKCQMFQISVNWVNCLVLCWCDLKKTPSVRGKPPPSINVRRWPLTQAEITSEPLPHLYHRCVVIHTITRVRAGRVGCDLFPCALGWGRRGIFLTSAQNSLPPGVESKTRGVLLSPPNQSGYAPVPLCWCDLVPMHR